METEICRGNYVSENHISGYHVSSLLPHEINMIIWMFFSIPLIDDFTRADFCEQNNLKIALNETALVESC